MRQPIRIAIAGFAILVVIVGALFLFSAIFGWGIASYSSSRTQLPSPAQALEMEEQADAQQRPKVWETLARLVEDPSTSPEGVERIRLRAKLRLQDPNNSREFDIQLLVLAFPVTEQGIQELLALRKSEGKLGDKFREYSHLIGFRASELPDDSTALQQVWQMRLSSEPDDQELFAGWARGNQHSSRIEPFIDDLLTLNVSWARRFACEWIMTHRDPSVRDDAFAVALDDQDLTVGEKAWLSKVYLENGGEYHRAAAIKVSFAALERDDESLSPAHVLGAEFLSLFQSSPLENRVLTWDQILQAEPRALEILASILATSSQAPSYYSPIANFIRHDCFTIDDLRRALPRDLSESQDAQFEENLQYLESEVLLGE